MTQSQRFDNPFRPGAGHQPPHLAGRDHCFSEFDKLLGQTVILENLVITGLRGVGKTVLLDRMKPRALAAGWRWVGTDLSEAASLTEANIATRLLADLSVATSNLVVGQGFRRGIGFGDRTEVVDQTLDWPTLQHVFAATPGLVSDKLKSVLELTWEAMNGSERGIVFAYDEAQTLSDHAEKNEFPLSLLLDVFQSLQKKNIPFMLVLTGLPTLFPKLVEARTFSERMFHMMELDRLDDAASREAISRPVQESNCPVRLGESSIVRILELTRGYPYFIQFVCREVFDVFARGETSVPAEPITQKLDADFFAGRWHRATDRQRELMWVIANTESQGEDFSVNESVALSKKLLSNGLSNSNLSQMLAALSKQGLTYKTRHGRYAFAVPLLGQFILRQGAPEGGADD